MPRIGEVASLCTTPPAEGLDRRRVEGGVVEGMIEGVVESVVEGVVRTLCNLVVAARVRHGYIDGRPVVYTY